MTLLRPFGALVALAACTLSGPGGAAAQSALSLSCEFALECIETEVCAETDFTATMTPGTEPGTAVMQRPAEEVSGTVGGNDADGLLWRGESANTAEVMTWAADGTARLSVHISSGGMPMVITYFGTCVIE